MAIFREYVRVFQISEARMPILASLVGALPVGMLNLAVLLFVRGSTGSLALAGTATGALSAGNAVGLGLQGWLMDRYGPFRVLVPAAVLCPAALVLLTIAATAGYPAVLVCCLAAAGGACIPGTTSGMRTLWASLTNDARVRAAAYALLATEFQVALIAGPVLVSVLVAAAGVAMPVLVAAGFAACGGLAFAASAASRNSTVACSAAAPVEGQLRAGVVTLLVGSLGAGTANGILVMAVGRGPAAFAGVAFSAFAVGELTAGVVYGGHAWRMHKADRLLAGYAGVGLGILLVGLSGAHPILVVVCMAVAGVFAAPVSITNSALLDDVVDPGFLTRRYTLLVSMGLTGNALGSSLGGMFAQTSPLPPCLAATAVMAAVVLWTGLRRSTLRSPSDARASCERSGSSAAYFEGRLTREVD